MKKKLTIGLFATSSPLGRKKRDNDFSYLKSKGFNIVESVSLRKITGHTAGTIIERINDLHFMIQDPEIDILMAYWGGGLIRINYCHILITNFLKNMPNL